MISLPSFQISRLLYERLDFLIYEGVDQMGRPVFIKTTKSTPSNSQAEKLKQEEQILKKINTSKVIKPLGFIEEKDQQFLILEKFGIPLNEFMANHAMDLETFLNIAIELAGGLGEIHHEHIIHKDIKPQNILIDPTTRSIKFQNFDLATFLSRETQQLLQLSLIEGTFFYISPEQTGRLNRALDYRTDIYSLGVVFYELLTKKLPFESDNPLELIHMHIAMQAISPHEINPEIPDLISDIVMKCLSKNMEERYHSAFGLQNDLEEYRRQLKTAQSFTYFSPGKYDIYDQFHIPQKLYGREQELNVLLSSFDRVCEGEAELLLVYGYSGIGKSSVVFEIQNPVAQRNGYFISGKYDQFKKNLPYSAIIQAFQGLVQQLLCETEDQVKKWKNLILQELGANAQLIIDVIPEMELIIGKQPPVIQLDFQQAEKRFNFVFSKFIEFFLKPEHPLVLFLDDLQWIDHSSLKFLQTFVIDSQCKHLLIIGSYRDNEVGLTHPLTYALNQIKKEGKTYATLELKPLRLESINQLISETFHSTLQESSALADSVYQKTGGNPFFTIQFLKMLYKEGLLDFNPKQQQWVANLHAIDNLQVTDNVAELMGQRIQNLPPETQNLLKIGSAIGNIFDLKTLATVSGNEVSATSSYLWPALEEELILLKRNGHQGDTSQALLYVFQHDRIQQAAYRLIPKKDLNRIHYQIGQALLQQTPFQQRKDEIITIVNQLNYGASLIDSVEEKKILAELNFEAGQKAKASSAQMAAIQYFTTGIKLLGEKGWEENYTLQFSLHENLGISQHLAGQLQEAENTLELLFKNTQTIAEKFKLYILRIKFYLEINDFQKVYKDFDEALKLLNIELDLNPTPEKISSEIEKVRNRLNSMRLEQLAELPNLQDESMRNLFSLMNIMAVPTYCGIGPLFMLLASKFVDLTLTHGLSEESVLSFVLFGMALASEFAQHYEDAVKYGSFAVNLIKKFDKIYTNLNTEFMYMYTTYRFAGSVNPALVDYFKNAAPKLYDIGNIMCGAGCYVYLAVHVLISGKPLRLALDEIEYYLAQVKLHKHPRSHTLISLLQEVAKALSGLTKDPYDPRPVELQEVSCASLSHGEDAVLYLTWRIFILFLFEKYQEALKICEEVAPFTSNLPSHPIWMVYYTYYALTLSAIYRENKKEEYKNLLQSILTRSERWAQASPCNYLHVHLMIKAEVACAYNDIPTAITAYDKALTAAEEGEYLHEAGIISELAGKFHFEGGRVHLAGFYWRKALQYYNNWGAKVKIEHFKHKYSALLPTVFTAFKDRDEKTPPHTIQSLTEAFEVTAVLKAAQALSKEIVLDKLIQTLMHLVKVEAGAEKVFFILPKKDKLYVAAATSLTQEQTTMFNEVPIEKKHDDLCVAVIYYVARKKESLLLNDAVNEGIFQQDLYVKSKKPKSILCFPLVHLGKISSILYLENNLTIGAFTPDRTRILELLSSQMAISIENAKFYAELEVMVADRTQEVKDKNEKLSKALENLTKMQKQMIQQEKLASLGLLSSGIAHELKNPLNFVINFSELASSLIDELHEKMMQEKENFNLEELKNDLNSLNELMQKVVHHSKRADGIVKGLLPHAYKGGAKAEKSSIPALIDQAVSLTLQVFRKKEPDFNVNIITKYDPNAQPLEVFPGELTRVFINLVDNAFFSMNQKQKKDPAYKPQIEIHFHETEKGAEISFKDNGSGVSQEFIDKIFQPFFTTKEVGEGTGLGLSISYDIITQQHGGKISVISDGKTFTEFLLILPKR